MSPIRRALVKIVLVTVFALAFFLVPTLQGINLVADQSTTDVPSSRAADDVASAEVLRLLNRS